MTGNLMHATRTPAVAVLCLLAALTGQVALAQEASLPGVYVDDGQSGGVIEKAIETAVAKMNFIKRPIARSRLKKTNSHYGRIEIARGASEFSVRFDAGKPVLMPLDGRSVKWTRDDGEQFDVSAKLQGDTLVQTFAAEDGQRTNAFSLGADGKLLLQVTLTSPQLPEPVRYQLSYRRQ